MDWMYKDASKEVDHEAYLLGKTVDKNFELASQESARRKESHSETAQIDLKRKVHEDPLFAIRKREMDMRDQLLKNPVKLKKLQEMIDQKNGSAKKRKKEKILTHQDYESMDGEFLDKLLISKYSSLKKKYNISLFNLIKDMSSSDSESEERHAKKSKKLKKKESSPHKIGTKESDSGRKDNHDPAHKSHSRKESSSKSTSADYSSHSRLDRGKYDDGRYGRNRSKNSDGRRDDHHDKFRNETRHRNESHLGENSWKDSTRTSYESSSRKSKYESVNKETHRYDRSRNYHSDNSNSDRKTKQSSTSDRKKSLKEARHQDSGSDFERRKKRESSPPKKKGKNHESDLDTKERKAREYESRSRRSHGDRISKTEASDYSSSEEQRQNDRSITKLRSKIVELSKKEEKKKSSRSRKKSSSSDSDSTADSSDSDIAAKEALLKKISKKLAEIAHSSSSDESASNKRILKSKKSDRGESYSGTTKNQKSRKRSKRSKSDSSSDDSEVDRKKLKERRKRRGSRSSDKSISKKKRSKRKASSSESSSDSSSDSETSPESSSESDSSSDDSSSRKKSSSGSKEKNVTSEQTKKYGLLLPAGVEFKRKSIASTVTVKGTEKKATEKWKPPPKTKLTEEEKERKLQEMMENAKWRDEERKSNIKKHKRDEDEEQKVKYDHEFMRKQLVHASSQLSVAERIKSNVNNIQRSKFAMDKHFTRH